MPEKKPKTTTKKAEKKLAASPAVTKLVIPTRYIYGESPLEVAATYTNKQLTDLSANTHLNAAAVGDFVVVQNDECDETFVIHKDVLVELAEKAGA